MFGLSDYLDDDVAAFEKCQLFRGGVVGAEVDGLVGVADAVGVVVETEAAPRDEVDEVPVKVSGCLTSVSELLIEH